jgi:O-antigen/teichoic acid export membrane protein
MGKLEAEKREVSFALGLNSVVLVIAGYYWVSRVRKLKEKTFHQAMLVQFVIYGLLFIISDLFIQ